MPTIKLSDQTKQKLESLMAESLRSKMESATGQAKKEMFMQLVQKRYGLTYDSFVSELIECYTKSTK